MNREIIQSIENAKKYLKAHPKDDFELEGLNSNEALTLKNKYFRDYNVKVVSNQKDPLSLNPYQLDSKLIIKNKGVKNA